MRKLSKHKFFTQLDLKRAYYHCPIRDDEKHFAAFKAEGELYNFNRLPFDLTNSVAVFQRIMNNIIEGHDLNGTYVYIDDIVIGGSDQEELLSRVKAFENVASQINIQFNTDKCEYNATKLDFLGHRIEDRCVMPDPKMLTPLRKMPTPSCTKSLKRVIGLFSYYSSWIANFLSRISPLLCAKSFPMEKKQ